MPTLTPNILAITPPPWKFLAVLLPKLDMSLDISIVGLSKDDAISNYHCRWFCQSQAVHETIPVVAITLCTRTSRNVPHMCDNISDISKMPPYSAGLCFIAEVWRSNLSISECSFIIYVALTQRWGSHNHLMGRVLFPRNTKWPLLSP